MLLNIAGLDVLPRRIQRLVWNTVSKGHIMQPLPRTDHTACLALILSNALTAYAQKLCLLILHLHSVCSLIFLTALSYAVSLATEIVCMCTSTSAYEPDEWAVSHLIFAVTLLLFLSIFTISKL